MRVRYKEKMANFEHEIELEFTPTHEANPEGIAHFLMSILDAVSEERSERFSIDKTNKK